MKVRTGFVSNSSSSSFVINKYYLSDYQIEQIKNHMKISKENNSDFYDEMDAWSITENENSVRGYTSMDNFNMAEFLQEIGVAKEAIKFDDYFGWDEDED